MGGSLFFKDYDFGISGKHQSGNNQTANPILLRSAKTGIRLPSRKPSADSNLPLVVRKLR